MFNYCGMYVWVNKCKKLFNQNKAKCDEMKLKPQHKEFNTQKKKRKEEEFNPQQ